LIEKERMKKDSFWQFTNVFVDCCLLISKIREVPSGSSVKGEKMKTISPESGF
jgi:hypothetical protein